MNTTSPVENVIMDLSEDLEVMTHEVIATLDDIAEVMSVERKISKRRCWEAINQGLTNDKETIVPLIKHSWRDQEPLKRAADKIRKEKVTQKMNRQFERSFADLKKMAREHLGINI